MSSQIRERRRRVRRASLRFVEALEDRRLLATITEFGIPASIARPTGITTGPDGALWFAEQNANKIGRITTAGTVTEFDLPANSNPNYITTGPDGALWFTAPGNNTIGRITTAGTVTEFTIPTSTSSPAGITTGPDGALWFAEQDGNKIGRLTTAGTFTEFGTGVVSSPYEIVTGSDGNLWFTEINNDQIGMIVPSGVNAGAITQYALAVGSAPRGIAAGSDGNLWFAESGTNYIGTITTAGIITEFAVPTAGSYPSEITSSASGDLFFTEAASSKIGRITTTGIISAEYDVPTANSSPNGITAGPDNKIWFVEYLGNQVASLSLAPVAEADSYTAIQDTNLTVNAAQGVLANDTGEGSLTSILVSDGAHGSVSLNADGSFTYTPDAGYFGPDSFTYKANDGTTDSIVATVNLTVDAPPVAVADSYTAIQDTPLTVNAAQGVLANDTDADGDPLSVLLASTGTRGTNHGSVTLNTDGSFTYTPDAGYFGPDFFDYQATDGTTQSGIMLVYLTVDAPPVAVADSYTAVQDTPLTVGVVQGVLANDTDVDSNPITVLSTWTGSSDTGHGSVSLNADGSFTYTPSAGYLGPDSFSYQATDGIVDSVVVTVSITVNPNTAPASVNDSQVVGEGGFTASVPGILANDADLEGNPLTALLVSTTSHGALTFNSDGSYSYVPNASFGVAGSDSFTYRAFDGKLAGNVATVTLTFDGTYFAPVAQAQAYTVAQGATLSQGSSGGLLSGAQDYWGLPLSAMVSILPSHGALTVNVDGSFIYTPDASFFGTDSFSYVANNGSVDSSVATVSLTVTEVNHAPVLAADSYTLVGNSTLGVASPGLLSNDTDSDGDPLTALLVSGPSHGQVQLQSDGSFSYTPARGFTGADSFSYQAGDGKLTGAVTTVTLTVTAVPNPATQVQGDYDGDGKADPAVYLPALGSFLVRTSTTGSDQLVPFGIAGAGQSIPAPGNYSGSGKTELAAYLPSLGAFAYRPSNGGADKIIAFGAPGQGQSIPAPGDYDGDGQTDLSVYLPALGGFGIRPSGGGPDKITAFGIAGAGQSIPAPGDYDGDGQTDLAVYLPSMGAFAYRPSAGGADRIIRFGMAGAGQSLPMPGDYSGSGQTELAVYMPSMATFAYRPANGGADVLEYFGAKGPGQTLPAAGDYSGSGKTELAAYIPRSGSFAIRPGDGQPDSVKPFGVPGPGQSIPATVVVDQALSDMGSRASAASVAIPNLSSIADLVAFPTVKSARKKIARN